MNDEFNIEESLAQLNALMDQANAASKDFAKNVKIFYDSLRSEGFDHDAALELTKVYEGALLGAK